MGDGGHQATPEVWRRYRGTIAAVFAALSLALLFARSWRIDYPYSIDFQVYWLAGKRVATGHKGDLYARGGGPGQGTPMEMPENEFKNIPAVALAFVPFAALEYRSAKRVFWMIDFVAICASAFLIGRVLLSARLGGPWERAAWAVAALCAFAPVHIALRHGQTTPLVLLALVGYLVASARGNGGWAGVSLALAGLVKIPVLLLAGLDIWHRRWKTLVGWATTLAATAVASMLIFGPELHEQYLEGLRVHAGSVVTGHNNQSVAAVVSRLMGPVPVFEWEPQRLGEDAFRGSAVVSLGILGALLWGLVQGRSSQDAPSRAGLHLRDSVAVLASAIVLLPVAWDHYFLLLIPGWMWLTTSASADGAAKRRIRLALLGAAGLALAVPTPQWVLDHTNEIGLPAALWISHYFFGAVFLLAAAVIGSGRIEAPAEARVPAR